MSKNKFAVALGRMALGVRKTISEQERARRREAAKKMGQANKKVVVAIDSVSSALEHSREITK